MKPERIPTPQLPATTADPPRTPFFSERVWAIARKVAIWAGFLGVLHVLADFLSLVVITFIACYILNSAAMYLVGRFRWRRRLVVSCIYVALVVAIAIGVTLVFPRAVDEGKTLYAKRTDMVHKLERTASQVFESDLYEKIQFLGIEAHTQETVTLLAKKATAGVKDAFKFVFHLFLSLIFSFLILFDLPKMQHGVELLAGSRIGPVYREIAPHVVQFFKILGKVFEAQVVIASCNTVITFGGLLLLDIPYAVFLSVGVFFGGFIPVLGVFFSSVPIVLVGLTHGGLLLGFKIVGLITLVHVLEAYVLNPQIMGEHLSIHPLAVIVVLLLGETFFGVWGLLLAVPTVIYLFRDLLRAVPEGA